MFTALNTPLNEKDIIPASRGFSQQLLPREGHRLLQILDTGVSCLQVVDVCPFDIRLADHVDIEL